MGLGNSIISVKNNNVTSAVKHKTQSAVLSLVEKQASVSTQGSVNVYKGQNAGVLTTVMKDGNPLISRQQQIQIRQS